MSLKFDIFCKVVDNFGDIGICWRLAKMLHQAHGVDVRLWVDNWQTAQQLIPTLPPNQASARVDGIDVLKWDNHADFTQTADVVLETFACNLPNTYQTAMQQSQSIWVNIDHLSAEAWVDDFHAQASPQPNGLKKYFYFPGFSEQSGGLLREPSINPAPFNLSSERGLNVSLFAYPNAPVGALFDAMLSHGELVNIYIPESVLLPHVAQYFNVEALKADDVITHKGLTVHVLPFLSQDQYDALLHACDINFVRGEDSWVRAIWAGKPFVWQPYVQEDDTHIEKLDAFLDMFYEKTDSADQALSAIKSMHHTWSRQAFTQSVWQDYVTHLPQIKLVTARSRQIQLERPDLVTQLLRFCEQVSG